MEAHLFQEDGRLDGSILYASDLFEPRTVQNLVDLFHIVLQQSLENPQTPLAVLPFNDAVEDLRRMSLVDIERVNYPRESSIADLFVEQVAASPDATAVIDSSSQLTYKELDRESNKLAAWLRRRHLAAETVVAVLAPRSCETIIAFLGILKRKLSAIYRLMSMPLLVVSKRSYQRWQDINLYCLVLA